MSSTAAQIQFAAEFVTVLTAAGGLALVLLRPEVARRTRSARWLLMSGFTLIGTAAFLHGSQFVSSDPGGLIPWMRIAGAALAVLGGAGLTDRGRLVGVLEMGLAVSVGAAVAELVSAPKEPTELVLGAGSLLVAAAVIGVRRRSIAARVAANAAATLLLVVLVISVALSAVISSSVRHDEMSRLAVRARSEAVLMAGSAATALEQARFVAGDLQGYFRSSHPDPLVDAVTSPAPSADAAAIASRLDQLAGLYPVGGFAYVAAGRSGVLATANLPGVRAAAVAGSELFSRLACGGSGHASVVVDAGAAWAVGAYPQCLSSGQPLGTVISATPLNDAYLEVRRQVDPTVSLALTAPHAVLATAGSQPPPKALTVASAPGPSKVREAGPFFVAAVPIRNARGATVASLVLSTPTSTVVSAARQLDRTLFLIAIGGTLFALVLASVTGYRITAGLRRLTVVAERIATGSSFERANVTAADEVGVLGEAFDAMIDSLEEQNSALQAAAEDETRLRNRLEAVVAGMNDALVVADRTGRVTDLNRAAEELTGWRSADAAGCAVERVLDLFDNDGQPLAERLRGPEPAPWTALGTLGPALVPVAVSAGALRGPGNELVGSVLVVRDLRPEREVERMKTEFLSRVGHELRTPLTGILGYADMLLRRDVDPDRARMWHTEIVGGAKRLLRIVEMLEFFASSGAGRVMLQPQPLDATTLVDQALAAWPDERLPAGVTLTGRVVGSVPDVIADRRWLGLALDELIDNAVKFSPHGGMIEVGASGLDLGGTVELSVTDTGRGMTAAELAVVFGDFVQGDASDTRSQGGLGLGLSLVQRVVAGLGGTVSCRSAPERGTTVVLRLPAATVPVDHVLIER